MFDELKKSISALLYERTTSPLFGTLVVSWSVWNWKIIYLTFFISEKELIGKNKIEYIIENYNDNFNLYWFPLISTTILITLIPFISNGAYWISIKFLKWKKDKKNDVEMNQLLTVKESIELRELVVDQEKRFENLLEVKNTEIKQLMLQLDTISNQTKATRSNNNTVANVNNVASLKRIQNLAQKIGRSPDLTKALKIINYHIQGGYTGLTDAGGMNTEILSFFESNDVIENKGKGTYALTEIGKRVNKELTSSKFE